MYEKNVSTAVETSYYFAGGARIAMRKGGVLSYFAADHLGSTSLTMDASGNKTGEMKYKPFGETRYTWGSTPTDRKFTGQRQEDSSLGSLYDYGARFYSPVLGRFLSADTIIQDNKNPQTWNRYSYAGNNPLRYNDPSGHCFGPFAVVCLWLLNLVVDAAVAAAPAVPYAIAGAAVLSLSGDTPHPSDQTFSNTPLGVATDVVGAYYIVGGSSLSLIPAYGSSMGSTNIDEIAGEDATALGAEDAQYVYRGVSNRHPELEAAKRGEAIPGNVNGIVTPDQHNRGGVSDISPFTSWTSDYEVAQANAIKNGPGGVILRTPYGPPPPGATWSWESSPDWYDESEILLRGIRTGLDVLTELISK